MSSSLAGEVLRRIRKVLPDRQRLYALHEPAFAGNELAYVGECIRTGWVSSAGRFVDRIEAELASYVGTKRAIAVVNGTAALQISLIGSGMKPGDEVLVPALTFVATANAVSHAGGIPHFVDASAASLNLDPEGLAAHLREVAEVSDGTCRNRITGRRIFGLIPVHIFGHACDVATLSALAEEYRLVMIEDIAEGLGTFLEGEHVGKAGKLAALSFNGNKIVTTGGGGAVLTDDETLGDRIKHLTTTAKVPHRWEYIHDDVGFNFRMPNLNAALGCAQLEQIDSFLQNKRALAARYADAFHGLAEITFLEETPGCKSNYWLNALRLNEPSLTVRDQLLQLLNEEKIQSRPLWKLMHTLPMHRASPCAKIRHALVHEAAVINIPSSAVLGSS
jgi:perosamine synthetase